MKEQIRKDVTDYYKAAQSGMITVEVSVIVPVILFVIVGSIWFLMFLLDMSVLHSEVRRVAAETGHAGPIAKDIICEDYVLRSLKEDNRETADILPADRLSAAEERMSERIRHRLTAAKLNDISVSVSGHYIYARSGILFSIPLPGVRRYIRAGGWTYQCSVAAARNDREEMLRRYISIHMKKGGAADGH